METLNKREIFAVAAMQGMLMDHTYSVEIIPELAVKIADNLINQLDQPKSDSSLESLTNPSNNHD
jgi:hypothetical protein